MLERIWLGLILVFIAGWALIAINPDLQVGQWAVYLTGLLLPALALVALARWLIRSTFS